MIEAPPLVGKLFKFKLLIVGAAYAKRPSTTALPAAGSFNVTVNEIPVSEVVWQKRGNPTVICV